MPIRTTAHVERVVAESIGNRLISAGIPGFRHAGASGQDDKSRIIEGFVTRRGFSAGAPRIHNGGRVTGDRLSWRMPR